MKTNGLCCKVRLGSRRFIQLSNIAEGSLEIALYIKKKGEEPYYCWERLPDEQEGTLFCFDAERYLKAHRIVCRPVEKQDYDRYAFEFRHYTNSKSNDVSGAYASGGGLAEEQLFDNELRWEAELEILERIGVKL